MLFFYNRRSYHNNCKTISTHIPRKTASLTIEAAFVLPLFIFATGFLISIILFIGTSVRVELALYNTSRTLSKYQYARDLAVQKGIDITDSNEVTNANGIIEKGINVVLFKSLVVNELGDFSGTRFIKGGINGLHFLKSEYNEEDRIYDLYVEYKLKSPFDIWGIGTVDMCQRAKIKAYDGDKSGDENQYVYVAPSGEVYHTRISCSRLSVKLTKESKARLPELRNANGGKYYPCKKCGDVIDVVLNIYISEYGDRYHTDRNCYEIKRDATKITLAEAKERNLPWCKVCEHGVVMVEH